MKQLLGDDPEDGLPTLGRHARSRGRSTATRGGDSGRTLGSRRSASATPAPAPSPAPRVIVREPVIRPGVIAL